MGRGSKVSRKRVAVNKGLLPTPEQLRGGNFQSRWMIEDGHRAEAQVRTPIIDTLWDTGKLTEVQHSLLAYYRDQALKAEDDVAGQSVLAPEKIMGGGGGSSPVGGYIPVTLIATPAILETARIERDLGSLRDIARAIAVDDMSLSRWCIEKFGGRERYDDKGKFVAVVPICEKRNIEMARLELKHAAGRIVR